MHPDATPAPPLRRAASDRILLGVCGGLARTLGVRPLLVRSGAVLLAALAFPLLVVAYAAVALIVPRDDGRALLGGEPHDGREQLLGWAAVGFAAFLVLAAGFQPEQLVWPALSRGGLLLAALTIAALAIRESRGAVAAPAVPGASAPGTPPAPVAPAPATSVPAPAAPFPAAPAAGPSIAPLTAATAPLPVPASTARPDEAPTVAGSRPLGDDTTQVAPTQVRPAPVDPPAAPRGRRRTGLMVAGIVLLVLAALTTAGAVAVASIGGIGSTTKRPATAGAVATEYRLGVGSLDIDLRDVTLPAGTTDVRARVGAGSLTVFVPRGVRVESVGATELTGVTRVNRIARAEAARARASAVRAAAATVRERGGRAAGRGGATGTRRSSARPHGPAAPAPKPRVVRIDADVSLGSGSVIALGD